MHALPRRAYAHFTPVTGPASARFAHFSRIRLADGDEAGAGGAPAGQSGTGDEPPAGSEPPGQDPAAGEDSPWDDPAKARAEIERLRRENGAARTTAKQQAADEARNAVVQDIGKALGLIKNDSDETPDAAALTAAAQAAAVEARAAKVELAVHQRAAAHKGDPGALLDSRAFLTKVADLDPNAADFTSKVDDAIKAAVQANPKLAATQVVGASSVDHAGGSGEGNHRPTTLNAAVSAAYTQQQRR